MVDRYLGLHRADGSPVLELGTMDVDDDPFTISKLELGSLGVREDVEADETGDGTVDATAFTDGAGVTCTMRVSAGRGRTAHDWYEELREALRPAHRHYLHIGIPDWPERRRVLVRGQDIPRDLSNRTWTDLTVQWKAIDGYLEDTVEREARLRPVADTPEGVFAPVEAPVYAPPADVGGQPPFDVGGRAPAWWYCDIYGDVRAAPKLTHADGWQVLGRSDLAIPPGHFVRILPRSPVGPRVLFDGDPAQDLYGLVDWAVSSVRPLRPGLNAMQVTAGSYAPGFEALVRWRRRWP